MSQLSPDEANRHDADGQLAASKRQYDERAREIARHIEEEYRQGSTTDHAANARLRARLEGTRDRLMAAAYNARELRDREIYRTLERPTDHDHEMARVRREIAERQAEAYAQCLGWALKAFGPGWLPSHRHYLVDKCEEERARRTGELPQAAATVYTARNASGEARHFTVEGGRVTEHPSYEAGFGRMLLEPHPTQTIEVRGQIVHPHHYSLCFAPYVLYEPKTAEELAALRATRERKKAEREEQAWADEHPLLEWARRNALS